MLVLKRYKDQAITIGDDIEILVTKIWGQCSNCGRDMAGAVKLGITAPRSVEIHRKEVRDRIRDESATAPANEQGETT